MLGERLSVGAEQFNNFTAFRGGFEAAAFEVVGFKPGQTNVVKRRGEPFRQGEAGAQSAEITGAELSQKPGGQHDAAQRREELPAFEMRAGQFEGESSRRVETEVDDGLTGAGDGFEPLLTDTPGRSQQPFLDEQVVAADARQ